MIKIIILAGGMGSRMNSLKPKVLHKIYDKTMIEILLDKSNKITTDVNVIVGYKHEEVEEAIKHYSNVETILQIEQLGTGHAIIQAYDLIKDEEIVVIINSDTPMIKEETIKKSIEVIEKNQYEGVVVTSIFEDKTLPYGRIIKDSNNNLLEIVEDKECNVEQLKIEEVNVGLYCFRGKSLKKALKEIENNNTKKEIYLTDVVYYMNKNNKLVKANFNEDYKQFQGINTKEELNLVTSYYLEENRKKFIKENINFIDIKNTYIGIDVKIEEDVTIYPNTHLRNKTIIKKGCIIKENSTIINSVINQFSVVEQSKIEESNIKENCIIGPFANIRAITNIENNVKIGSFVEIKNSNIDSNTKIGHLAYMGDSKVGKNVNIGAGVVTANMNTKYEKNNSVIEDGAFIGSNSILIAPISVGKKSIVAASSTISKDVEDKKLVITRANLEIKNNDII